jgi:hypothetical protein
MARQKLVGATAAAILPAALSVAVLVSAPFAGTTTAPIADTQRVVAAVPHHQPAATKPNAVGGGVNSGLTFHIPAGSIAALVAGEIALLGVGVGVMVAARRRRFVED